jgi:hypothetical protein
MWMRWLAIVGVCLGLQIPAGAQAPEPSPAQATETVVLVVTPKVKDLEENHYLWASELAAARLRGTTKVLEGGLAGALRYSRENPGTVRGIVEIMIDVYSYAEEVRITCMDAAGRELWKEKARANMGGSEESLARKMLERALAKAEKRPACGK